MSNYEPHWVLVKGRSRCQECGEFHERAWKWFPTLGTYTVCWCEACVQVKLAETA